MSEQYKALTRKYRPVSFSDIVSQEHVSQTLLNAIEGNRLNHAYLFCGPRGVGKTTMARVLARKINDIGADIDGEALNQTLNIIEIDAASNNKVEDAHRIRDAVRVPPQSGRYKIFIIDEVHMLTKAAFNALLKTLEEPPAYAIFIFATTEPHKVLPTILSRVQRFDFKPISVAEIVQRLQEICTKEDIRIDEESLHMIARKADGALRDALGILDQVIALCGTDITYTNLLKAFNAVSLDRLFHLTRHILESDAVKGIKLISDLLQEGHDIQEFLIALTEHFRNLLLARDKRNHYAVETSKDVKEKLYELAQAFSEDDLMRMLHIVHEAQFRIREAHQPKILLEITALKLIKMEKSDGLNKLFAEIEELKQALGNSSFKDEKKNLVNKRVDAHSSGMSVSTRVPADSVTVKDEINSEIEGKQPRTIQVQDEGFTQAKTERPSAGSTFSRPGSGTPLKRKPKRLTAEDIPQKQAAKTIDTKYGTTGFKGLSSSDEPKTAKSLHSETATEPTAVSNGNTPEYGKTQSDIIAKGEDTAVAALPPAKTAEKLADLPPENAIFDQKSTHNSLNVKAGQNAEGKNSARIYLNQVVSVWQKYVTGLREPVPSMVRISMESTKPVELSGRNLKLECNDLFVAKLIEEHEKQLSESLESYVGKRLKINCSVRLQTEQEQIASDPYERFRQLQEKDPRIRTIVETFGAELEW